MLLPGDQITVPVLSAHWVSGMRTLKVTPKLGAMGHGNDLWIGLGFACVPDDGGAPCLRIQLWDPQGTSPIFESGYGPFAGQPAVRLWSGLCPRADRYITISNLKQAGCRVDAWLVVDARQDRE